MRSPSPAGPRAPLSAVFLCGALLLLAILLWPQVLRNLFPLQWQVGSLGPAAFFLSLASGAAALWTWLARQRVRDFSYRTFPTARHTFFALGTSILAVGLLLGLAEIGLRIFHYPFRLGWTPPEYQISRFDRVLGWSYIPNLSTVQRFGSEGRPVSIYFDDMGSRVDAPATRHSPAAPTALFVGCSYTFGHGLPFEETFVGRLAAMPGFPFQAINLGVQGYGTDQSLLSLKQVLPKFNTQVVVYTFLLDHVKRNDNADRRFIFPKARFPGTKPRYSVDRGGSLRLVSTPRRYDEIPDCHVCDLLELFWTRWGPPPSMELTRALVKDMKEYVESKGATFVLVLWTNPHRMDQDKLVQALFPGMSPNVVDTGAGAPPQFSQWMIPGEIHPDARAHAYVAHRIVAEFRVLGLLPKASSP